MEQNNTQEQEVKELSFREGLGKWMSAKSTIAAAKADRKVSQLRNQAEYDQQRYEEVTRLKLVKEIKDVRKELYAAYPSDEDRAEIAELLAKRYR